jgi:hypothetical protein
MSKKLSMRALTVERLETRCPLASMVFAHSEHVFQGKNRSGSHFEIDAVASKSVQFRSADSQAGAFQPPLLPEGRFSTEIDNVRSSRPQIELIVVRQVMIPVATLIINPDIQTEPRSQLANDIRKGVTVAPTMDALRSPEQTELPVPESSTVKSVSSRSASLPVDSLVSISSTEDTKWKPIEVLQDQDLQSSAQQTVELADLRQETQYRSSKETVLTSSDRRSTALKNETQDNVLLDLFPTNSASQWQVAIFDMSESWALNPDTVLDLRELLAPADLNDEQCEAHLVDRLHAAWFQSSSGFIDVQSYSDGFKPGEASNDQVLVRLNYSLGLHRPLELMTEDSSIPQTPEELRWSILNAIAIQGAKISDVPAGIVSRRVSPVTGAGVVAAVGAAAVVVRRHRKTSNSEP